MKKNLKILMFLLLAVFLLAGNSFSLDFGTNITIPDGSSDGTSWHGTNEDNEVEPGMDGKQIWDLEAFFLDGTRLTMVGGFDFWDGVTGYSAFTSGDIFISTDGINTDDFPDYTTNATNASETVNNDFGYEYVLDMNWDENTYDVYELTDETMLQRVYYEQNDLSNAWRYASGGEEVIGYQGKGFLDYNDIGLNDYDLGLGLLGGAHYFVSIDLSFLGDAQDFTAHFTMGCGNDNLMGSGTTPVPEPATMLLFGSGLIVIAGLGRKRFLK